MTQIKIDNEWYDLCACVTCGEVHAVAENINFLQTDRLIKCCKYPDNFCDSGGAEVLIEKFMEEYPDEEYRDR